MSYSEAGPVGRSSKYSGLGSTGQQHEAREADPSHGAVDVVERYLNHCAGRELNEAQALLAESAVLVFPGGQRHGNVRTMFSAANSRYRWVDKHRDTYDVARREDGSVVVVSTGRLFGENLIGQPFSDIRYVDRFVIRDGLICEQHVWNDLSESGVLEFDDDRSQSEAARGA